MTEIHCRAIRVGEDIYLSTLEAKEQPKHLPEGGLKPIKQRYYKTTPFWNFERQETEMKPGVRQSHQMAG